MRSKACAIRGLWLLALASAGCSSGSNGNGGATAFRADAQFAYVMYLDGPCDASTSVDIDLDTGAVRVGTGPSRAQAVKKATLTSEEVDAGRRLFADDRLAEYRQASLPASPSSGTSTVGGAPPNEEAEGASTDGTGPSDTPGTAPSICSRDAASPVGITVFTPPGMARRTSLRFAKAGLVAPASELLDYFSELSERYHP